jgi:hypothetical protein
VWTAGEGGRGEVYHIARLSLKNPSLGRPCTRPNPIESKGQMENHEGDEDPFAYEISLGGEGKFGGRGTGVEIAPP